MLRTARGRMAMAALVFSVAAGLAGCGAETPPTVSVPAPTGTGFSDDQGASTQVGPFVEVIGARVLAPPAGAEQAQVAMTLVNSNPSGDAVLVRAGSPAARDAEFTSHGRVITTISIPVSAGFALPVGPPNPDRLLLTGLRRPLRAGQFIVLSLTFAQAGHVTLRVPVIPEPDAALRGAHASGSGPAS